MCTKQRKCWTALAGAGFVLCVVFGTGQAAERGQEAGGKALDKEINASLKTVINKGADLFNMQRDFAGCYRMYQGALITVRPLLGHHPKLQKTIDDGLAEAEATPAAPDQAFITKAFALRKVLDEVRTHLKGTATTTAPKLETPPKETVKTPTKEPEKKVEKTPDQPSLWERLGGEDKVRKIVDDFVRTVENDPKVDFTRGGEYKVKNAEFKKAMVELLSQYTGGPLRYSGPNMKETHKNMKITNAEFDASVADLKKSLKDNHVDRSDADELVKLVEKTRKAIVQKSADTTAPKKVEPEKKQTPVPEPKKIEEKKTEPGNENADLGHLAGKVLFDGQPAPIGYITLVGIGKSSKSFSTFVNADGTYRFKTLLPAGVYNVAYKETVDPVTAEANLNNGKKGEEVRQRVSVRYNRTETSGLTVEVTRGDNSKDFDLRK